MTKVIRAAKTVLITILLLTGCSDDYDRGYSDGLKAAEDRAFVEAKERGYSEGFHSAYPGSPLVVSEPWKTIYSTLAWLGLLKVLLILGIANYFVIVSEGGLYKVIGKSIYSSIGVLIIVFIEVSYRDFSRQFFGSTLFTSPDSVYWKILISTAFTVTSYYVLYFGRKIIEFIKSSRGLAWYALVLSACITLFLTYSLNLFWGVPDISAYSVSWALVGVLFGILWYVANSFLAGRIFPRR